MRSLAGLTIGTILAMSAPCVRAQVLELGDGGTVRTFDGPAVITRDGVAPIGLKVLPTRRSPATTADAALRRAAQAADLSPELVSAVAWRESGGRPGQVSRAGAIGEMQLMPATARALGVDPRDSVQNYRGGATYLGALMRRYDGDLLRTLAAYNAGPGAVDRHQGAPPYRETQAYVAAVMERLSQAVLPAAVR